MSFGFGVVSCRHITCSSRDHALRISSHSTATYSAARHGNAVHNALAELKELEWAEMLHKAPDARAVIRDERIALHAALQRREPCAKIAARTTEAKRVRLMWAEVA